MHQTSAAEMIRPPNTGRTTTSGEVEVVFYTATEVSAMLRLDESTLYRHLRKGAFPGIKIGGRYVVPRAALVRLIELVIETGNCVDLATWTRRWRDEHALMAGDQGPTTELRVMPR